MIKFSRIIEITLLIFVVLILTSSPVKEWLKSFSPFGFKLDNIGHHIAKYSGIDFILDNPIVTGVTGVNSGKNNRRSVSDSTKKIVASSQSWKCNKCIETLDYTYEIDHIIPLYKGGNNDIKNLQALCRNCHGKKTLSDKYI